MSYPTSLSYLWYVLSISARFSAILGSFSSTVALSYVSFCKVDYMHIHRRKSTVNLR